MKLFILRPIRKDGVEDAWTPWYDKAFGFIVRTDTEEKARTLADDMAGDENRDGDHPWLDPSQSTCEELLPEGDEELLLKDFASA